MSYSKQTWVDNSTPLSAARLNNMEQGIANATVITDFPVAVMRNIAAQTLGAAGWFALNMGQADIDTHSGWSSSTPTRWTCPANQAGTYAIEGNMTVSGPQAGTTINCSIKKNGSFYGSCWMGMTQITNAASIIGVPAGRHIMTLAPGDYVEVWGYYSGGTWATYVDANAGPSLIVERIR